MMANIFDQFDTGESGKPAANIFDQFDTQPKTPGRSVQGVAELAPSPQQDFVRSIPGGIVNTFSQMLSGAGRMAQAENAPLQNYQSPQLPSPGPNPQEIRQQIESYTGQLPRPAGMAGRFGEAVGGALANPLSYVGPGGLPLKIGTLLAGGVGGQAGEEIGGTPGQIAGSLVGGFAGAKALSPAIAKAAVPTVQELRSAADRGYAAARASGLELDPAGVAQFATAAQQSRVSSGFTGGPYGTAPKTTAILDSIQNPPSGATITAANLDTIRKSLGRVAQETAFDARGFARPTPDAAAASATLADLRRYTENLPRAHIVAGDAADYVRNIKQANGDYAAALRTQSVGAKLSKAENAVDRQISGSLESQIKSKIGGLLDNPRALRDLTQQERDQIQLINSGSPLSNTLRQAGRLSPRLGTQGVLALATGGGSIPWQLATLPFYGARKASEAMTVSRANTLDEMLRKRSPEYQSRISNLPPADTLPNRAALIRALLAAAQQ